MKRFYYSIYGPLFEEFTSLKRSLGYKYHEIEYTLSMFDRFVLERKEVTIGLSKELSEAWCIRKPNESEKTWYNRIQVIRQFSSFLCSINYSSYLPKLPRIKCTFKPYIFSTDEIELLFAECDRLKLHYRAHNTVMRLIPALFRMLYATGLRLSEALMLTCDDVNLQEKYLLLRNCKNGKDRIVPISDSLAQVCHDYLNCRKRFPLQKPSDRFFIHPNGAPCAVGQCYKWFRIILYRIGIPHGGRGLGPRLHDLRHTFSVHSLATMAEAGSDLYYSLPLLSTYLGHQSVASTNGYVRLTAEMYPSIMAKVNQACPYLFPEIYKPLIHEAH